MKKGFAYLALAALIAGPQLAASALSRDELKIGITQEFENMNPLIMQMVATNYMGSMVGRTLLVIDPSGKWIPQLAKTIPTFENKLAKLSADKKTLTATWEIKENASWGDGTPVTCADFAMSREIAENPNVSIPDKEVYTQVAKIDWDAKTPKKCLFTYDKPRWDFYQLATFHPVPKHLEDPVYRQYGSQKEGYEKNSNYSKNPTNPGLYNGPYLVSEVKLSSHVSFVPNPKFYGKQPKFKKIVIKLIPNTGTLEANLRSGTIDKISSLGLTFDQAIALDKKVKNEKLDYEVMFKPSLTYEHIDLNLDNPILKDLKVRKALVHAINREELVKALFEGKQVAAKHFLSPQDPWFTADPKKVTVYPFDKKEAAKLLDEAGWKMGADGYRYKDGKKLSFQLMTTAGNKSRETVQAFLQGQWKASGIEITIKNEPARVFFADSTKKRQYPAMAMYAWVSAFDSNPKSTLGSDKIPTDKNGWSGQNYPGWSNAKVDELIKQLDAEFVASKRVGLVQQIAKQYTEEVPVIPLYYRADIAVTPKELKHFRLAGHQFHETNEIENWDLQ